jgi:hypothetical protein
MPLRHTVADCDSECWTSQQYHTVLAGYEETIQPLASENEQETRSAESNVGKKDAVHTPRLARKKRYMHICEESSIDTAHSAATAYMSPGTTSAPIDAC